ncbi:hypothetical protein ACFL35_14220, partial [Candidatus Riflebacteria bacterium]
EKKKALKEAIAKTANFVVQTTISEFEKLERSNPDKLSEVSSEAEKAKEKAKEKVETAKKKTTTVIHEGGAKQVDATGKVLKEIKTIDGEQVAYEYEYDENGKKSGETKVDASKYMTDGKYHFRSDEMVKETLGETFKPESEGEEATGSASGGVAGSDSSDTSGSDAAAGGAAAGAAAGANAAVGLKGYAELSEDEKFDRAEAEAIIAKLGGWVDADAGIASGTAGGGPGGSSDTGGDTGGSDSGAGGGSEDDTGGDSGTSEGGGTGTDDGGTSGGTGTGDGDTETGSGDSETGETGDDKPVDSTEKSEPGAIASLEKLEKRLWYYLSPEQKNYEKAKDALDYARKKLNEYGRDGKLSEEDRKKWWAKIEQWQEKVNRLKPVVNKPDDKKPDYPGDSVNTSHPDFEKWLKEALAKSKDLNDCFPKGLKNKYGETITKELLIKAILYNENRGVHSKNGITVQNSWGFTGWMQISWDVAKETLGANASLWKDPKWNLIAGTKYSGTCMWSATPPPGKDKIYNPGDTDEDCLIKAIVGYNRGPYYTKGLKKSWQSVVKSTPASHREYMAEGVNYGIQAKMGLGLELSRAEKDWLIAYDPYIHSDGDVKSRGDEIYSYVHNM